MFKHPTTQPPKDLERVQFKIVGDPKAAGIREPTIGRFHEAAPVLGRAGMIGSFVDEESGYSFEVWDKDEHNEVEGWRPVDELLKELH